MSNDLNGLDDRISTRGFFERILQEFKETLAMRDELLDERFRGQKDAINKAEQRLDVILKGFPQEYAKRIEIEQMQNTASSTAKVLEQRVVDSAKALAEAQAKSDGTMSDRVSKVENFTMKLLGGLAVAVVLVPTITAVVVYLLTRHGVPIESGGTP